MDSNEPNKDPYMEKRKAAAQLRLRDTYSQISSSRKEELLLTRRMKNQHLVKHASLQNSTPAVPEQSTSSWCRAGVSKQCALTIREPPPLLEKALHHAQSFVTTTANNKEKGKGICSPFVISETVNKAQGQTLDFVGIYLREPVFSHGQLYVALSRARSSNCVKILIRPPTPDDDDDHSTYNIVYNEIIEKAFG